MKSMTDEAVEDRKHLSRDIQFQRLQEWANMLEKRVAELDPLYRAYPFGRIDKAVGIIDENIRV